MSKYERFLIYPLLIMALVYGFFLNPGISARPETEQFDKIVANEILVQSDKGQIKIDSESILIVDHANNTYGVILAEGMGFRDGQRGYTLSLSGYSFRNVYGQRVIETLVDEEEDGKIIITDKEGEQKQIYDYQER